MDLRARRREGEPSVVVAGGTEIVDSPPLDQVIKTGRLGFYWLRARLLLGSTVHYTSFGLALKKLG